VLHPIPIFVPKLWEDDFHDVAEHEIKLLIVWVVKGEIKHVSTEIGFAGRRTFHLGNILIDSHPVKSYAAYDPLLPIKVRLMAVSKV